MISLEEARELILNEAIVSEVETIHITECLNRVLAEDIYSKMDSPPFHRSPLDGFCLKAENLNGKSRFKVIDSVYAGHVSNKRIENFQAIKIMTGAKIPEGGNTIVRQEDVIFEKNGEILINVIQKPYDNFIFKGEDFKKGTLILEEGRLINSNTVMAIASLGISEIKVFKKPVVGIITTGDELLNPGDTLIEGKIFNSNKIFLQSRLLELSCDVKFFDAIEDKKEDIENVIKKAEKVCDILISTGGVSVGEKDLVRKATEEVGYKTLFWKVDIKPGSPMFAAVNKNKKLYIGLSGTPVAAATTFELTVRGLIAKILKCKELELKEVYGILQDDYKKVSKKRRFLRVKIEFSKENKVYIEKIYQSPGQISTMINSNGILEVPKGKELKALDLIKVYI